MVVCKHHRPIVYKKNVSLHKGLDSFMVNFSRLHFLSDYTPEEKVLIQSRGLNFQKEEIVMSNKAAASEIISTLLSLEGLMRDVFSFSLSYVKINVHA